MLTILVLVAIQRLLTMTNNKEASTVIRFWAPFTATYDEATYSIEFKCPEEGNSETRARNQSTVRTRAGNTFLYDRGNNYNTQFKLDFKDIPDSERAQLIVFLEAVQWGLTKVKYRDPYGEEFVVRVIAEQGIEYRDNGLNVKKGKSFIRWDFSLALLNLTDNPGDLDSVDNVPTSALLLHIQDYNDPHSPASQLLLDIADGVTVADTTNTMEWRNVLYTVIAVKGTASATFVISLAHNREDLETDATAVELVSESMVEQGDVAAHITFSADVDGALSDQVMRLKIAVDSDGWAFEIRKIKVGSQENVYE